MRERKIAEGRQNGVELYQYILTVSVFLICSVTDLRWRKIDKRILAVYLVLLSGGRAIQIVGDCGAQGASAALSKSIPIIMEMLAGIIPGIFCLALSFLTRQGLGYGDSVLILLCGMSIGFSDCMAVLCTAFFSSGIWALILLSVCRKGRKSEMAFAPFLAAGILVLGIFRAGG